MWLRFVLARKKSGIGTVGGCFWVDEIGGVALVVKAIYEQVMVFGVTVAGCCGRFQPRC